MIWLLLSILSSAGIMLIFKQFKKYEISTFHAIVVNYFTAVAVGLPLVNNWQAATSTFSSWAIFALILGTLFITLFFLIGITTQQLGVSVSTVSMKLGYVLPIILAFTYYGEEANTIKLIAIAITLVALVLSSVKTKAVISEHISSKWVLIFPFIIFFGSGICDAIVQYSDKRFFQDGGSEAFIIILFATAATLGLAAALLNDSRKKQWHFTKKNILAGILLGIPNYGSIYFMFKALNAFPNQSAVVFPLNNIGIVVASTLLAIILFKEKLSPLNIAGFILAILSISIMSYEQIKNSVIHLF